MIAHARATPRACPCNHSDPYCVCINIALSVASSRNAGPPVMAWRAFRPSHQIERRRGAFVHVRGRGIIERTNWSPQVWDCEEKLFYLLGKLENQCEGLD